MSFLPAYVVCILEPPAGERPRSVAHGSVRNELVGRLCMMQLVHEGFETSCAHLEYRANHCVLSAVLSLCCGLDNKQIAFVHIDRCLTNV